MVASTPISKDSLYNIPDSPNDSLYNIPDFVVSFHIFFEMEILKQEIKNYLKWDKNPSTNQEICQLEAQENWKELEELLLNKLVFGTAGLRQISVVMFR